MKVKLVMQHGLKADGFFDANTGTVFNVIRKRDGGYDVDLGPLGFPEKSGWMYEGEVEEVNDSEVVVNKKKCGYCNGEGVLNKGAGKPLFAALAWLGTYEENCNSCGGSGKVPILIPVGTAD